MSNLENDQVYKLRHSCAHILAQAVVEHFACDGPVQLAVGPPIEDGFYYDFGLPRPINEQDLEQIEARMKQVIESDCRFTKEDLTADDARKMFQNQPYKLELIELLSRGVANENGDERRGLQEPGVSDPALSESIPLSIYRHGDFVDLCRGPHVERSCEINPDAIKLLNVSGAHWRGEERNPLLHRIYGTVWQSRQELDSYLRMREEAKKYDHREIGKKLKLFHFDQTAPGMPYWLPDGLRVLNVLIQLFREEHDKYGYEEIATPLINDRKLWEISGHWDHYKDNMFLIPVRDDTVYGLKPMNCPNAMVVYNLDLHSYRDLPLRLSDCDVLHRNERSGSLGGLFRVQKFQQDDAHIFVAPEQIEEEFEHIFKLIDYFYGLFSLPYIFRLSLRPDKFVGEVDVWDKAERILESILERRAGKDGYIVAPGEGAFYGPKVDILMKDSLGRKWQMGTIQLDFQLPSRFNCKYIDSDGKAKVPVVIHRAIYGSLDRFIAILLEHTAGNLPLWLAPLKAIVIPIADRHHDYAESVSASLRERGIRCEIDKSSHSMNRRIREAELKRVPYIIVVGDKEAERGTVSVRYRGGEKENDIDLSEFALRVANLISDKTSQLR